VVALPDRTPRSLRRFEAIAHRLYRDDPHWVAPLFEEVTAILGTGNPFWHHAEAQLFVAQVNGFDVGRIASILDRTHNSIHGEATAHFGWFDCADSVEISQALFEAAKDWAKARGMTRLVGPMSPSINGECGQLVEGFDSSPTVMMTYAPAYHVGLIERAGFRKLRDLLAFDIDLATCSATRVKRLSDLFRRRYPGIQVRRVTRGSLAEDVPKIKRIYNDAWEKNWGAVPLTDGEMDLLVHRLKPLLVDGLVWLAETADDVVGFMLLLPDANEIIKPLRGSMFSRGLFRALPYLMGWRVPRIMRLVALGTRAAYRGRGLEAVMFSEALACGRALGFQRCEPSWVLEDNQAVHRLVEVFQGRVYKRYRIYETSWEAPLTRRELAS